MKKIGYIATVHLLVDANDGNEAADTISSLLSEHGLYVPAAGLTDWSYLKNVLGGYLQAWRVEIPSDYDRDTADLCELAAATKAEGGAR